MATQVSPKCAGNWRILMADGSPFTVRAVTVVVRPPLSKMLDAQTLVPTHRRYFATPIVRHPTERLGRAGQHPAGGRADDLGLSSPTTNPPTGATRSRHRRIDLFDG